MWDDVIIGKGPHICSAVTCFDGVDSEINISENQNSYWISGLVLGGSIKVYKNTNVGKKLTEMLSKTPIEMIGEKKITKYLNKIFLGRCNPEVLLEIVKIRLDESYERGKEMKAAEIRSALGIFD